MPVRESERELSNIEFLKVLRDIEVFLVKRQNEKPKKFRYFFSEHLISHSADAYSNAKMANSIYVTDVDSKKLRKIHLQRAYIEIQSLISQIDVLYCVYKSDVFTNAELENISKLMHEASKLIKGVINADKKRYKDII